MYEKPLLWMTQDKWASLIIEATSGRIGKKKYNLLYGDYDKCAAGLLSVYFFIIRVHNDSNWNSVTLSFEITFLFLFQFANMDCIAYVSIFLALFFVYDLPPIKYINVFGESRIVFR